MNETDLLLYEACDLHVHNSERIRLQFNNLMENCAKSSPLIQRISTFLPPYNIDIYTYPDPLPEGTSVRNVNGHRKYHTDRLEKGLSLTAALFHKCKQDWDSPRISPILTKMLHYFYYTNHGSKEINTLLRADVRLLPDTHATVGPAPLALNATNVDPNLLTTAMIGLLMISFAYKTNHKLVLFRAERDHATRRNEVLRSRGILSTAFSRKIVYKFIQNAPGRVMKLTLSAGCPIIPIYFARADEEEFALLPCTRFMQRGQTHRSYGTAIIPFDVQAPESPLLTWNEMKIVFEYRLLQYMTDEYNWSEEQNQNAVLINIQNEAKAQLQRRHTIYMTTAQKVIDRLSTHCGSTAEL